MRDDRGYTALHAIAAYNRWTDGREIVPVVRTILRAADEVDYAPSLRLYADVSVNDVDEISSRRGSWRLLSDQENRASWSPLHLVCVQGGIARGKVPLMKAMLQVDEDERVEVVSQFQCRTLMLLDR
ncbi:hypothetical protein ACHAXA_010356 [Cyclostephanos tholiformis]|uniref:Ankyrin repeat protein n=1 Tax=Cyclostephanos tholiformis TaxID=382380 RepID=A0ABD3RTX0_9STRA